MISRAVFILPILLGLLVTFRASRADTLTLTDGTTLQGSVMKSSDRYWIETPDGKSRFIPADQVKQWTKDSEGATATATGPADSRKLTFSATKARAESGDTPLGAVALWQTFIDSNPSDPDIAQGKVELERWKKMAEDGAEKINGRWVTGPELKTIYDKAEALFTEAEDLMTQDKTIQAVKKLEEAVKIYPNAYGAQSFLGYISLTSHKEDDAIQYFNACLKLKPNAVDALNNLGITLLAKKQWAQGIEKIRQAAEVEDTRSVAVNLNRALAIAPPDTRKMCKAAGDAASLLASKYGLVGQDFTAMNFLIMEPRRRKASSGALPSGMISSGTGFIVRDDGLILTNRHVVEGGTAFLVQLDDGKKVSAELVTIGKDQDLALLRIKNPPAGAKFATISVSSHSAPDPGVQCFVLGYPLLDRLGATLKVTQGIVSGNATAPGGVDVLIDAKVNPGNSGGPLLDKYGQVVGVVTMKSVTSGMEDSMGMAISAGKIRKFLTDSKVDINAAATAPATRTADPKVLSAEEVVAKVKSATVCIIATH